jgi:spore germination protein GerM
VIVLLAVVAAALAGALWHIYPEYRELKARQQRADRAPSRQVGEDAAYSGRPVVAALYFARIVDGKQRMVAIKRELPPGLGVARGSLEELLRGEVPRGCDRPLPSGTELLGIGVADGVATVDFSEQLRAGFQGGSDNEQVTVYSIVNTLTSLPGVDSVQVLIEGEKVSTVGGHHDISGPLAFDEELVVPHS